MEFFRQPMKTVMSRLRIDLHFLRVLPVTYLCSICLALLVLFFESCSVTEQTPGDVGQKFEEGIKGNGKIVPDDKDRSQTGASGESPVTKPAGVPSQ
jgi:hypothetical protein